MCITLTQNLEYLVNQLNNIDRSDLIHSYLFYNHVNKDYAFDQFLLLDEHIWRSMGTPMKHKNGKELDALFTIDDKYGKESLFGHGESLYKRLPEYRFMTNYIGPDCITRPQYCDNGFSVGFDLKGLSIILNKDTIVSLCI